MYSEKPWSYGLSPIPARNVLSRPVRPIVKMKARARGMPAKFEATPENVMSPERNGPGRPPAMTAYAITKPKIPPARAVMKLISMLVM